MSGKEALKQRQTGSEIPCRWLSCIGVYTSEMTLGEAIVRDILSPPKYILSIFSYQKDLEKYEKRKRQIKDVFLKKEI